MLYALRFAEVYTPPFALATAPPSQSP
ncbi:hypothetical protein EC34870_2445A, partial [Escherichia coli 3.4870]